MTKTQMKILILRAINDYKHASKFFCLDVGFLNISYGKHQYLFTLADDFKEANEKLEKLRK